MNRSEEFQEVLCRIRDTRNDEDESVVRQRLVSPVRVVAEPVADGIQVEPFSRTLLSEAVLLNETLKQLGGQMERLTARPEQLSFSPVSSSSNQTEEIERALNICTASIALLADKLADTKARLHKSESRPRRWFRRETSTGTSTGTSTETRANPLLEHCGLVLSFLQSRVGRVTETIEGHKERLKRRRRLYAAPTGTLRVDTSRLRTGGIGGVASLHEDTNLPSTSSLPTQHTPQLAQLQLENSRMMEDMAQELFSTLATTEMQVLEISRLQTTLQTHLQAQHDLATRLFHDSERTVEETTRGNAYLQKTARDSGLVRTILVAMMLSMSLLLLLLHYFKP